MGYGMVLSCPNIEQKSAFRMFDRIQILLNSKSGEGSTQWVGELEHELEDLLAELRRDRSVESLTFFAKKRKPNLLAEAVELENNQVFLLSELCDLIYLLQITEGHPEINRVWLHDRIRHFVDAWNHLKGECNDFAVKAGG